MKRQMDPRQILELRRRINDYFCDPSSAPEVGQRLEAIEPCHRDILRLRLGSCRGEKVVCTGFDTPAEEAIATKAKRSRADMLGRRVPGHALDCRCDECHTGRMEHLEKQLRAHGLNCACQSCEKKRRSCGCETCSRQKEERIIRGYSSVERINDCTYTCAQWGANPQPREVVIKEWEPCLEWDAARQEAKGLDDHPSLMTPTMREDPVLRRRIVDHVLDLYLFRDGYRAGKGDTDSNTTSVVIMEMQMEFGSAARTPKDATLRRIIGKFRKYVDALELVALMRLEAAGDGSP